jgi:hypothetical protein
MNTRSQTKKNQLSMNLYEVKINFDEASISWRANKKCIGHGQYKYICLEKTKSGNQCKRESLRSCDYCKAHSPQPCLQSFKKG